MVWQLEQSSEVGIWSVGLPIALLPWQSLQPRTMPLWSKTAPRKLRVV